MEKQDLVDPLLGSGADTEAQEEVDETTSTNGQKKHANELDGKTWTKYSISIWSDLKKTSEEVALGHPGMFPAALAARLIEIFTNKEDKIIFDPFVGVGSTVVAAQRCGKQGVGIDLNPEFVEKALRRFQQPDMFALEQSSGTIYNASCLDMLKYVQEGSVDLVVTSPPYWDILNQKRTADYKDIRNYSDDGWYFPGVCFDKVNLLVGSTGAGKTRLLNTIFNLGVFAANKDSSVRSGTWDITFTQDQRAYRWHLHVVKDHSNEDTVVDDNIWVIHDDGSEASLIHRDANHFSLGQRSLPQLPHTQTSVVLLREEPEIEPLYRGFSSIMRRFFSLDALRKVTEYQAVPPDILKKVARQKDLSKLAQYDFNLNLRLYVLQQHFSSLYAKVCEHFQTIFPFVGEYGIRDLEEIHGEIGTAGRIPVFCIQERGVNKPIELGHFSSGMQKVLLVLTDIYTLPAGAIYLMDEYENSLGLNAIDFLPDLLFDPAFDHQFFITSHHPYMINKIPVKNWYVFHRRGNKVAIRHGDDLADLYSKSKQEAFTQLINDEFFVSGVE